MVEYEGTKTDLAISRPLTPFVRPGPLTIHGVDLVPGHAWTYHRFRTIEGESLRKKLLNSGHHFVPVVRANELEHAAMVETSNNDELIRRFLDKAPDGATYRRIAAAVKNGMER